MPDIVNVQYKQTGQSKSTNAYGMREMQGKIVHYRFDAGNMTIIEK